MGTLNGRIYPINMMVAVLKTPVREKISYNTKTHKGKHLKKKNRNNPLQNEKCIPISKNES